MCCPSMFFWLPGLAEASAALLRMVQGVSAAGLEGFPCHSLASTSHAISEKSKSSSSCLEQSGPAWSVAVCED
eukprot:16440791-Heterocapsa_arctica.AAC.1